MSYFGIRELKDFVEGRILVMDKPLFWTSFDLVKKTRAIIERKIREETGERSRVKVGHAGTLDPLADGLMHLCTGKKTKILDSLMGQEKEYVTTLELGRTTPSFDLETMFDHEYSFSYLPREELEHVLDKYTGNIDQVPPRYSAKSVGGRRAYKAARTGEDLQLKASRVRIEKMEILDHHWPIVTIRVVCSKGTYIRALARDLGDELETGAHLIGLTRTRIGNYHLEDAFSLEKFEQKIAFL